jgi:hypothetical protein
VDAESMPTKAIEIYRATLGAMPLKDKTVDKVATTIRNFIMANKYD